MTRAGASDSRPSEVQNGVLRYHPGNFRSSCTGLVGLPYPRHSTVAFYDGADPGVAGTADGAHFRGGANVITTNAYNAHDWNDLIRQLSDHVDAHGPVRRLHILDHGGPGGMEIGNLNITLSLAAIHIVPKGDLSKFTTT